MKNRTNQPPKIVTGSLLFPARPFTFEPHTGAIQLDRYAPQTELPALTASQQQSLAQAIRSKLEDAVAEIRFGEYFCEVCQEWAVATTGQWSVGMCLSCSLDRGSEMADFFHSEESQR